MMTRTVSRYLLLMLAVAGFVSMCVHVEAAAKTKRPNVIVIMTDDQGYGEFSCHGNPITETPHIDELAAESVRLTDFHVAPMCTPTRGQLLTGLDAFRNGAINVSSGRTLLRPELKTMANVFQNSGYRTGLFGKWHLGDNYPFRPEDRGFEEAIWFPSSHINSVPDYWNNDYFEDTYIHNGKREQYSGYCTDVFFREAQEWMKRGQAEQPFFAYIALNAAHWPWFVPDEYRQPIRDAIAANPEIVKGLSADRQEGLVSFLAMGANIDDNVGRLDAYLEESGLKNDTIVVFLTDNGSTFGQDYYNAGMRGKKTQLWEGGHRVPCFVRWPAGKVTSGKDIAELCHVQDLLPTLAELAGVSEALPERSDGVSLAPLLTGQTDKLDDRMLVINYSRMPGPGKNGMARALPRREGAGVLWKHWRLLEDKQLYNVKEDPHQDRDVATEHPQVVAKMREHLDQWWDEVKHDVLEPQRVVIGNAHENPMMLTACEWLDVFVDQQIQIRRGVEKNGVWHLQVAEPGTYTFELRRWPRESGKRLDDGARALQVTDGEFVPGKVFPIAKGRLRIEGQFDEQATPTADGQAIRFETQLNPGPIRLQTWMLDENGDELCGAYYLYVERTPLSE